MAVAAVSDRLWAKVEKIEDCWEWKGSTDSGGYGQIREGGRGSKLRPAHRVAYELLVGPIPNGLQIDHLCRKRSCVNPAHLEPVSQHENILRGFHEHAASKTHCKRGHAFDAENTYVRPTGHRKCRACQRKEG